MVFEEKMYFQLSLNDLIYIEFYSKINFLAKTLENIKERTP